MFDVYAPHYGEFLLNHDYFIINSKDLLRRKKDIHRVWGDFFIRPVSGDKSFDGHVVSRTDEIILPSYYDNGCLVVIAPTKVILQEFRHIVYNGEIITSSRYKLNGKIDIQNVDKESKNTESRHHLLFAKRLAQLYTPGDELFVLDTCECIGNYGNSHAVVEINSFSFSDFYACDRKKIVDLIESIEWN